MYIFIVISCNEKKDESPWLTKNKSKKIFKPRKMNLLQLYNSGQLKNIGYYADDATTFFPNRPPLVGKEAIIDYLKSDLDSNTDKFHLIPMRFLYPMMETRWWKWAILN